MTRLAKDARLTRRSWNFAASQHQRACAGIARALLAEDRFVDPVFEDRFIETSHTRVLHPFCGDAKESLSLLIRARRSARLIGIDFSSAAIRAGRKLIEAVRVDGRLHCAEVGNWLHGERKRPALQHVVITPGSLWWYPDAARLFRLIATTSLPGTRLTIWEFDDSVVLGRFDDAPSVFTWHGGVEDYYGDGRVRLPGVQSHDGRTARNPYPATQHLRSVDSLLRAIEEANWTVISVDRIHGVFGERYDLTWLPISTGRFAPASTHGETHSIVICAELGRPNSRVL